MDQFSGMGKILMIIGGIIFLIGIIVMFSDKIPFIGKLPGDILIRKKNFTFYFPLATSIVLSLLLTLIFYIIRKL